MLRYAHEKPNGIKKKGEKKKTLLHTGYSKKALTQKPKGSKEWNV